MFVSEFVAVWISEDLILALRYKLRIFGVLLYGMSYAVSDNQGVVNNTSLPQYNLGKMH